MLHAPRKLLVDYNPRLFKLSKHGRSNHSDDEMGAKHMQLIRELMSDGVVSLQKVKFLISIIAYHAPLKVIYCLLVIWCMLSTNSLGYRPQYKLRSGSSNAEKSGNFFCSSFRGIINTFSDYSSQSSWVVNDEPSSNKQTIKQTTKWTIVGLK